MTAPIASGWSESPGGPCTHWKAPPLSRRTPISAVRGTTIEPLVGHGVISGDQDRLPVLVAGEIVVSDEELANAGLSAIPGEGDIHAPILRLSLGRVVRSNGARFAEALSRQQAGIYTFRHEINHHARRPLAREVEIV